MITLRQNPNEPTLYIGSERGGGRLPSYAPESSPKLVSTTPVDNSGAVSTTPLIRLTFDSPVALGSGTFFVSDGTTQSYVDPGSGLPAVRIVGATHTVQFPASSATIGGGGFYVEFTPPGTLKSATEYFVYFKPGAIVGAATGLPYAGLSDATMLNFVTSTDTTNPVALSAKTTNAAGVYKAGDVISIVVNFSETVTVTGSPKLELNTAANRFATLSGPSSGTSLTFSYTVQAGDTALELGFVDLIDLASGIVDASGNPLTTGNIAFATMDAAASSGQGSDLVIDTTAPTALAWNVTEGATDVGYGSTLSLSFTELIKAAAGAKLFVNLNGTPTEVLLSDPSVSISGNTLFLSGLAANTAYAVTLGAGAIEDLGGNPLAGSAAITFATAATSPSGDTIAPKVLDVSSTSGAAAIEYNVGSTVKILVTMSETVTVGGVPRLQLSLDGKTVEAVYSASSGKVLTFDYVVQAGDNVASLAYAGSGALLLPAGATITDVKGNAAVLTLPAAGTAHSLDANTNIEIDTVPFITGTAPFDDAGSVALGNNMLITFSEAMTMAGSASSFRLMRNDGTFSTQIPANVTVTGTVVTFDPVSDLELNKNYYIEIDAGALADSDGNLFAGLSGSSAYNFNTTVDSTKPSATLAQTTNPEGTYKEGDTITIKVTFDETVTVTGSPRLELNLGTGKFATHTGAATGTTLDFAYVVQEGDVSSSLDFANLVGDMTGIADMAGNVLDDAHITFTALTAAAPSGYGSEITIDGISPQLDSYSAGAGMTDISPDSPLFINFTEAVKGASPTSAITVSIDGVPSQVLVSSLIAGSASSLPLSLSPNKSYVVTIPAGTLTDTAGNPVADAQSISFSTMAVPSSGDTIAPKVLDVTYSGGGDGTTVSDGGGVSLIVTFSEAIQVTGSIVLNLQVGSQVVPVSASSHEGNKLYFNYLVAAGQNTPSLQYVDSNSLVLGDAFIRDMNNNNAVLTLPAPGAPGSLDYNTNIVVDTLPTLTSAAPADGAYNVALNSNLTFTFSENMSIAGTAASFRLFKAGSPGTQLPVVATMSGAVLTLNPSSDLDLSQNYYVEIDSGALVDSTGNAFGGFSGSSDFHFSTSVDTTAPVAQSWNFASGPTDLDAATTTATLTFNENIFAASTGTPKFILALDESDGTEEVLLSDPRVTISGQTISLTGFSSDTYYGVYFSNGALVDAAGNAVTSFPELKFGTAASPANLDTIAAKILNVSASVGSSTVEYTNGNVISIQVTMSEAVTVSGGIPAIKLQLNSGTVDAVYSSNSGKLLTFIYTVQPGDHVGNLAYVDSNSLFLNGATIVDQNGNFTSAILPAPGAAGSLDVNTNISINTAPTVTAFSPADNASNVAVGSDLVITFTENIVLSGSVSNIILYRDELNGSKTALPINVTVTGNTLTIDPLSDLTSNADYHVVIGNTVLTDSSGKAYAGIVGSTEFNFGTYLAA